MASSDFEIHRKLGTELKRLYALGPARRVVRKDQNQQFDPEKRLKSPKKQPTRIGEELSDLEDLVTLNQSLPTDNLGEFWYHSYSSHTAKPATETCQTKSSSAEDFVLHIELNQKEPE